MSEIEPAGETEVSSSAPAAVAAHTGDAVETQTAASVDASDAQPAAETPAVSDKRSSELDLLAALKQVIDPELMVNIVDLGLVYSVAQDAENDRRVAVEMTLTSPACPAGPQIVQQAKMALERLNDVDEAKITLTMSPPWTPDRMTDDAKDQLGIF